VSLLDSHYDVAELVKPVSGTIYFFIMLKEYLALERRARPRAAVLSRGYGEEEFDSTREILTTKGA
jgi:hypothetical protein